MRADVGDIGKSPFRRSGAVRSSGRAAIALEQTTEPLVADDLAVPHPTSPLDPLVPEPLVRALFMVV